MKQTYETLFHHVLRIRLIEEEVARVYPEQEMRCPIHLSVGQEATPVGFFAHLRSEDQVVSTHRAHAHYLAKNGSLKKLLAELYGRVAGCTRGQGGSMHLIDLEQNFIGSTSIVGGTIPVGVGAAFAAKLSGHGRLTVVCIGDTALEEGVFHESMNFAAVKKLPVIFLCENNGYSCYSPLRNRQPDRPLYNVAGAHGIPYIYLNGNDVFDVYEQSKDAIQLVRQGQGPLFVQADTFRFLEHCGPYNDDHLGYRLESEIRSGHENDAVLLARKFLQENAMYSENWEEMIRSQILLEVRQAFEFAKNSPYPDRSELGAYTYAK